MGRVASSLDDSIGIHNDPNKLERRPQIYKVNVNGREMQGTTCKEGKSNA